MRIAPNHEAAAFASRWAGAVCRASPRRKLTWRLPPGNADAADRLTRGLVVSSIGPRRAGVRMVGWGAVAEMVVDQLSGAVLAAGPLPQAELAYRLPHGWYEADQDAQEPDQLRLQRGWVGATALLTGLSIRRNRC